MDQTAPETTGAASPALLSIARRLVWWLSPEEALSQRSLLVAQLMTLGTWDDVEAARAALGEKALRETLNDPPTGIFDAPSWHYWHHRFGHESVPPLPKRRIP